MQRFLFDAYGTLFDLGGALAPAQARLGDKASAVLERWRGLQLDYAWLAALEERYRDFETLTREAFQDALATEGIADAALLETLSEGFCRVAAYPDAKPALAGLKEKGAATAILSNGSPEMLEAAVANAGLDEHLDAVLSVDAVRNYKPAPAAYTLGTDFMDEAASEIVFVSSNWWDVAGAGGFGYRTVWIDRGKGTWPPSRRRPERIVTSLAELVALAG